MGRLILLFLIVVGAVLFVHWLMNEDPKKIARALKRYGLWIGIGALLLLVATGRLNWLFALAAAAIPFAARLLSLLRYVPILSHLYTSVQNARAARSASGMSSGGASSQVESRFLRMVLEHDTGHMDGEVLEGAYQGQRLSQLSLQQMLALYDEYREQDEESTALLEAYLDRNHPDWREQAGAQPGAGANPATGPMGRQEASEILGVPQDADRQSIVAAHRKLMQKLHPDRGGSTYLAAKVNQAKDVLLADAD